MFRGETKSTIETGGLLAVAKFTDQGIAGTLVKGGGGILALDNSTPGNVVAGNTLFQVNAGTLRSAGADPLTGADVVLNGGTLELKGATTVVAANALRQVAYNIGPGSFPPGPGDAYLNLHQNNGLMVMTPFSSALRTGALDYGDAAAFSFTAAASESGQAFTATGGYMNLFRGYLSVPTAGTYTFRMSREDDRGIMWLDLNQDGVFQSNTGALGGNNGEQLRWEDGSTYTVTLQQGKYMFAVGHADYTPGATCTVYVKSPAMGSEAIINPTTQAGMWSVEDIGAINAGSTNLSVTGKSALRTLTDDKATLGTLTLGDASTLTTSGGKATFSQIDFSGPAGRTATLEANNTVSSPLLTDGSVGGVGGVRTNFIKSGVGTLTLPSVSARSDSTFEVKAGTLSTLGPTPLGNSTSLTLSGGTFEAVGAPTTTPVANALRHTGYFTESPDAGMNLHNNNGLLITPVSGSRLMTRDVIAHYSDTDFMATGAIGWYDWYINMWGGYFTAPTTGTYGFRIGGQDYRSAIWLDLGSLVDIGGTNYYNPGDGVFRSTNGAPTNDNGELIRWQNNTNKPVNLIGGQTYKIAYLYGDNDGGSNIQGGYITLPGGAEMLVNPGNPAQTGLWKTDAVQAVDMSATNVSVAASTTTSVLRATSDYAMKFGKLSFGANSTLTTGGAKSQFASTAFAPGSTLLAGINGADLGPTTTSGGQTNVGSAIANIISDGGVISPIVTASTYDDQGTANSIIMRIYNGGTLVLDNSTPGSVKAGSTTFRIEANSMLRAAPAAATTPVLGAVGTPKVLLAGGTLSLQGTLSPDRSTDIPNALSHYGFHTPVERTINLDGSNGIVTQEGVLARVAYNRVRLTNGPNNIGLSFTNNYPAAPRDDYDFLKTGAIGQADNYSNVWLGYLNVPAAGGAYQFRIGSQDDRGGIWIDLNNNGKFESATGGLERSPTVNNGELIAWSGGVAVAGTGTDQTMKTYTFPATAGPTKYLFAVTHAEGGGGSAITAYVKSPSMTGQALIAPSDPAQAGMWSIGRLGDINATNTPVTVVGNSTLSALTDGTASFPSLSFGASTTTAYPTSLTTGGGTIKFAQTNISDPNPTVSYVVPAGTVGNQSNHPGPLGMDFDLIRPLTITSLGLFDSAANGLAGSFSVRLYNRDTQAVVTSLTFSAADQGTLIDGSRFKTLATPITLPAGFRGSIVADVFTVADPNGNLSPAPWTVNTGVGAITYVGGGRYGNTPLTYPTTGDGGPVNRYAAGTFQFAAAGNYAGINAASATYPGVLNGAGAPNLFFTQGTGDVVLDQPGAGLQNTIIETRGGGGRLIVGGPATVAGATLSIGAPVWTGGPFVSPYGIFAPTGTLHLTSPDGNPTTYPNPIHPTASGTLAAGPATVLSAGSNVTIGQPTGAIILPDFKPTDGAVITMRDQIKNCCIILPNGVNSPSYTVSNAIAQYGYHINSDVASDLNYYYGMGMYNNGKPTAFPTFYGKSLLTTGPKDTANPTGRGLDFNDDVDFHGTGAIGQPDNYSNLFLAKLNVTTPGTWNFRITNTWNDDNTGLWIDLNRNGVFESSLAGLGSNRGEQLFWNEQNVSRSATLAAGEYLIAFTHREGTGGSKIQVEFQLPGSTTWTTVKPSDPNQAGLWNAYFAGGGLDIAEGETRTLGPLTLATLTLSPGGQLNRAGTDVASGTRNITVTDSLTLSKDLAMTHGEKLVTTGATVAINPGATLYVNQPVNAASLDIQGNLVRLPGGTGTGVTVTQNLKLASTLDFTDGSSLTSTGANIGVASTGKLALGAPIQANALATAGTVTAPGGSLTDLILTGGKTTLTANTTVTGTLQGGGGTLVAKGGITLDASSASLISLNNTQLRVEGGNLTLNVPAVNANLPAGLAARYDARVLAGTANGALVTNWADLSGNARDLNNVFGQPTYAATGPNGGPVVRFFATDGTDALWSTYNFDAVPEYTVFTVERYDGGADARLVTSRTRNWLFGHHGGGDARWHAEGWITPAGGNANRTWDINAGTITSAADPVGNFWFNGTQTTINSVGSGNANYMIGQLQLGSYSTGYSEASNGDVAEILIFNRVLTGAELTAVGSYLESRYGLTAYNYPTAALTRPALFGDLSLEAGRSVTLTGGAAEFSSIATNPKISGGIALSNMGTPAIASSADAKTLTLDATLDATSFNVTGPGTVAITKNLTVASGGSLTVAADATLRTLATLTIAGPSATALDSVSIKGALHVASGTLTVNVPAPAPFPTSPIGYWPLSEGTGTTTADFSGGGNSGTINANATWVNDSVRGWVLNFPSSGSVTIPAAALSSLSGQGQVTLSLWQYGDVPTQPRADYVFEARNAAAQRVLSSHLPWSDSNVYWDAGNSGGTYNRTSRTAAIKEYEGQWNNWVFWKDATTGELRIYLNGQLWQSGTGQTLNMETITAFRIGSDGGGGNSYAGMLDEFAVWNRPLTPAEIQNLYRAGIQGGYGAVSLGKLTMDPGTSLVLGGSGQAAFDSITAASGTSITGTVTNRGLVSPGASPGTLTINGSFTMAAGSSYRWETTGATSDLIAVTGNADLSQNWNLALNPLAVVSAGAYDVMTYGSRTATLGTATPVRGTTAYADLINLPGTSITTGGTGADKVSVNLAMKDLTQWTSAGTAWDQGSNWTNGVPSATKAAVVNTPGQIATVTPLMGVQRAETLIIDNGHARVEAGATLEVVNNAWVEPTGRLTVNGTLRVAAPVLPSLYLGLAGYWPLNEGTGTTAKDATSGGRDGTFSGGATWVTDPTRGTVVQFNGTSGKIDVPYSAALNPSAFSFQAWAMVMGGTGSHRSPVTSRDDAPQRGYIFYAEPGDTWQYWTGTGAGWVNVQGPAATTGSWYDLVGTYDGTAMRFYINGALIGTTTTPVSLNTARPLRIGAGATEGGGNYWFNGLVDDVAVWNRALTDTEVLSLYQAGLVPVRQGALTTAGTTLFGPDATIDVPVISVTGGTTTGLGTALGADTTLKLTGGTLAGAFTSTNKSTTPGKYAYEIQGGIVNAALRGDTASLRVSGAGAALLNGPIYLNTMSVEGGATTIADNDTLRLKSLTVTGGTLALNRPAQVGNVNVGTGTTLTATRGMTVTTGLIGLGTLVADGAQVFDLSAAGVSFGGEIHVLSSSPANSGNLTVNVPPPGLSNPALAIGLVGRWTFDASNAADLSGNGNTGAVGSSISFSADTHGGSGLSAAAGAGGGNTRVITVPTSATMESISQQLSLSFWVKGDNASVPNWSRLFQHANEGGGTQGWLICKYNTTNDVNMRVDTLGTGGVFNQNIAYPGTVILDNAWHQMTYVLNNGAYTEYVDGAVSTSGTYGAGNGLSNTRNFVMFGTDGAGAFVGQLDDVAVWNRPLLLSEVKTLYDTGFGGPARLGNLKLGAGSQFTLGGSKYAQFDSIGTLGSVTVSGDLGLGGAVPKVTSQNAQDLTIHGTLAATNFQVTGSGTITLRDNVTMAAGSKLTVPAGAALATEGAVTFDAASAASVQYKGGLNIRSGSVLTLNTPTPAPLPTGAIGRWAFDETSGTIASDASGNGRYGNLVGNATFVPGGGMIGGALTLDDSGDWVAVPGTAPAGRINIDNKSFSLSIWAKRQGTNTDWDGLMGQGDTNNPPPSGRGYALHTGFRNQTTVTQDFNGDGLDVANAGAVGDTANWHHWAFTYDVDANIHRIYSDGQLIGTSPARTYDFQANNGGAGSIDFWIGRIYGGNEFGGLLDDAIVYDRVLGSSDIQNLYRAGLQGGYSAARFGNLTMAPGAQLILGGSRKAGFTSIASGDGASITGDVVIDQLVDPTGKLTVSGDLQVTDGMVFKFDLTVSPDPKDLIEASTIHIDKSFTLQLFGAGGTVLLTDKIRVFEFDTLNGLYINGVPWDATTNPLQYLLQCASMEDPYRTYFWDTCNASLVVDPETQSIYLTGLIAELVPEPTSLLLLGMGALALRRRLRRRRRSA